ATFKVARDSSRPFRVRTPVAVVEVVGTQFNVYARPDSVTRVSVLEGRVKVTNPKSSAQRELAAGEEAKEEPSGTSDLGTTSTVTDAIAWQQRKLIFKRTALEDIAAEFNRYNKSTQIHLDGVAPGKFRFSGAFNADDPQSLATLLQRETDLTVTQGMGSI